MEERGMNERIQKLRRESHTAVPHLSIERAVAVTEAYEKYAGRVEIPLLRALTFRHILGNENLVDRRRRADRRRKGRAAAIRALVPGTLLPYAGGS